MMLCGVCKMRLNFCPPDVFVCPTGHYAIRITPTLSDHTTAYTSRYTLPGGIQDTGWGEITRTPVPSAFHEAFKDGEVLEP